jgi:hypothetical protein
VISHASIPCLLDKIWQNKVTCIFLHLITSCKTIITLSMQQLALLHGWTNKSSILLSYLTNILCGVLPQERNLGPLHLW